jgi:hypothetical protein
VQVPDFGDRFWVYSAYDTRTDEFSQLGKMYGNKPGFYLLVGPNWTGETPKGITKVFRATTNSGSVNARIFMDDTPEDKQAVQSVLRQIMAYPLAEFDGTMKSTDWSKLPVAPAAATGDEEIKWVVPEKFFDELPAVLKDAPAMPGEEARYAQVLAVVEAANADPKIKAAMTKAAVEADAELIKPVSISEISACNFRTIGAPCATELPSARTISCGPPSRSPTFWSTQLRRRLTSIRTWTRAAGALTQ